MTPDDSTLVLADGRHGPGPEDDSAPLSSAYRKGELIGDKYELVRLLGEGGMGVVWLARNRTLGADVAIKLLRAGQSSPTLARRMLKEAQSVARLGHPAILRVFDFGTTHRGDPFMVMEVLDGEDLARTLERNGRLSPIKAVRTLLPVLHALGTAHQKDIVHRDLKPENIFLTTTDSGYVQPKVVDFGIVKTREPELDKLTRIGAVLGTPAYLSPEQARGEDVDHRVDIWSGAVVLYEMLTCRLPFEGCNYNSLMRSIIEDQPPPLSNFGIDDPALWAIIERGLAKRSEARWPSMAAFGGALASWLLAKGETDDISGTSLRAAWQQGPSAAHPDDLYSARPLVTGVEPPSPAGATTPPNAPRRRLRLVAAGAALAVAGLYVGAQSLTRAATGQSTDDVAPRPSAAVKAVPPSSAPPMAALAAEPAVAPPEQPSAARASLPSVTTPAQRARKPAVSQHKSGRAPSRPAPVRFRRSGDGRPEDHAVIQPRACLLRAALCAALSCPPAWAGQASPPAAAQSDAAKNRAQELLASGVQAFRARRFKPAIDAFLAAHDLYPSAAISFNLARAYESLKDAPSALRFYRDYLRRAPDAPDAESIGQRIEGLEDELRARGVQQVSIRSIPAGATLLVDERPVGLTPWTGELVPGVHRVRLTHEGNLPQQETFELSPHRALDLELTLAAEPPPTPPSAVAAAPASAPLPSARPSGSPDEAAPRSAGGSVLPWVVLGAAGVALGGAVYFEFVSAGAEKDAHQAPTQPEADDHIDSMHSAQTTARVLLGAGAALAVTGGVWLVLSSGEADEPAALALGCRGLACHLRGAF